MQASALPPPPPPEAPPVDPGAAPTPVNKVDLMEQAKNRIAELEAEVGVNNLNKNNNKKKKKTFGWPPSGGSSEDHQDQGPEAGSELVVFEASA